MMSSCLKSKSLFKNLLLILFTFCFSSVSSNERGDIISYELVQEWENKQVEEEAYKLIEGIVSGIFSNESEKELLRNLLGAYVRKNLQSRSLKFYKLNYHTIDFEDNPATASGLVIVPQRPNNKVCNMGLAVYNHGTIFGRYEVPSYYFENGQYRSGELFFSVMMAAMEFFTIVPDYYGMGDGTGIHHHNMFKTNANSVIDMMRAGRKMASEMGMDLNDRAAITGYSEGGTVTMGIAKMIHEDGLKDEFPKVYTFPASGAYDLSDETYKYILNNPFYPTRSYILYIAASCQDLYKNMYDPNDPNGISYYLKSPYDELYKINLLNQTGNVGWVPLPWPDMFNDGIIDEVKSNPNHPLRACLMDNDVYDWPNPYETMMFYCNTDEQVPPSGAVKTHAVQQSYLPPSLFWNRFKIQVHEVSFNGLMYDHATCALPSILFSLENMKRRRKVTCQQGNLRMSDINESEKTSESAEISTHIFSLPAKNRDVSLELKGLDNRTVSLMPNAYGEYNVSYLEPGIYLYRPQLPDSRVAWDYFIKTPLQYVNTDDYNPVKLENNGFYSVDISLLSEKVNRLDVYNELGNKVISVPNKENKTDKVVIQEKLPQGIYTVMVVTSENEFPLRLNAKEAVLGNNAGKFLVYRDNDFLHINSLAQDNIQTLEVFDMSGKQIFQKRENATFNSLLSLKDFPAGMYMLRLNGSESHKFIR